MRQESIERRKREEGRKKDLAMLRWEKRKSRKKLSTVAPLQNGYYGKIFFVRILGPCYYPTTYHFATPLHSSLDLDLHNLD